MFKIAARSQLHKKLISSYNCSKLYRYVSNIRNVGVVAHIDAGKTTTSEQMLFLSGETNSIGRVDDGDTVMDFLPQERERGITISSAAVSFNWNNHVINLIDTPGHVDFTIEVERSARVLDGAILVVDAVAGVQAQTQTVWKQIKKQKVATIALVNKMDREGANFKRSLKSIKNKLQTHPVFLQIPIGSEDKFYGVVDLVTMNKITWGEPGETVSSRTSITPIVKPLEPSDELYFAATDARNKMIESLAEVDETILEKYISEVPLTYDDLMCAIRRNCINGSIIPSICGSSLKGKGVDILLNSIVNFLPSPEDRSPNTLVNKNNRDMKKTINCQTKEFCALAFKVVHDPMRGNLVFIRIYSGSMSGKQMIFNTTRGVKERVTQLLKVNAEDYVNIQEASSGDVVCLVGLKSTITGDTLVDEGSSFNQYVLKGLSIPEVVYSIAIEPEKSSQQTDLLKALSILQLEDPSLVVVDDKESGQLMLGGLGELHLEIVVDKLKRQHNLTVYTGKAYVAYRESLRSPDESLSAKDCLLDQGKHVYDRVIGEKRLFAAITYEIESLVPNMSMNINESENESLRLFEKSKSEFNSSLESLKNVVVIHKDVSRQLSAEEYSSLCDGLHASLLSGPNGYPIVNLKITILSVQRDIDSTAGAMRACASTLVRSVMSASKEQCEYEFLEPVMRVEVSLPSAYVGSVLSDLTVSRRAEITEVLSGEDFCDDDNGDGGRKEESASASANSVNNMSRVVCVAPLSRMLGYASALRSMTQGEGGFSMEYCKHQAVDFALAHKHT